MAFCRRNGLCREIVSDAQGLFTALKRTQGVYLGACDLEEMAGRLAEQEQCLCIVNTKRHAGRPF